MEFGLFMMPLHPPNRSYADSYDRDLELLVLADALGYHEAWIGEHVTETWENAPAPELIIAQALARTKNIILGTGVTLLPLHHPVDTAHRIAMLDHLARGRLYWGVGMRSIPTDLQMYGLDPEDMDSVRERSREALEIVLGLWASEDGQYHYDGKHFSVHSPDAPAELNRRLYYKPYQKPHPPIGMAATSPSPSTPYMAGSRGWIPLSSPTLNAEKLRVHWDAYEDGANSSGHTPRRSDWRIARDVYVSDTPERAREEARIVLGRPWNEHQWKNRRHGGQLEAHKDDPDMPDESVDVDFMMEHNWIVGDPAECADKITRLYESVGGFGQILVITHDPDDHSLVQRSLKLLKEEVAPRVEALG